MMQCRERWKNRLSSGVNKSPWQPEEELIFIAKHKNFGNKWTETAKSLDGRNDNAVKNHFYSSVRKIIRKIRKQKITNDLKQNDVERELTIYLSQYMLEMYQDYLNKKKMEKNLISPQDMNNLEDNADMSVDANEENKSNKDINVKKGDKYIIRKLISFKVMPEQIQDFINKVTSITSSGNSTSFSSMSGYQMSYPNYSTNVNQFGYADNSFMNFPQNSFGPVPQNTMPMNNSGMNMIGSQNMGYVDDSQLIQNFAQMSLMNQNSLSFGMNQQNNTSNYNSAKNLDMGLNLDSANNNNNFGTFEGQLSSLPPHMKTPKITRSNSISGIPSSAGFSKIDMTNSSVNTPMYMGQAVPMDNYGSKTPKQEAHFCKCQSTSAVEQIATAPLMPASLKLRKAESDQLSHSSYSSKSSVLSFNDAASCSSLDLSFDGSGKPYLKNPPKVSAFAKVKGGSEANDSVSEDDDSYDHNAGAPKKAVRSNNASPVRQNNKKKSSFFRLKDIEDSDEG